jgi:hypothetical protein
VVLQEPLEPGFAGESRSYASRPLTTLMGILAGLSTIDRGNSAFYLLLFGGPLAVALVHAPLKSLIHRSFGLLSLGSVGFGERNDLCP